MDDLKRKISAVVLEGEKFLSQGFFKKAADNLEKACRLEEEAGREPRLNLLIGELMGKLIIAEELDGLAKEHPEKLQALESIFCNRNIHTGNLFFGTTKDKQ